jgi:hypothetical protein
MSTGNARPGRRKAASILEDSGNAVAPEQSNMQLSLLGL